jgi:hypothetical protein
MQKSASILRTLIYASWVLTLKMYVWKSVIPDSKTTNESIDKQCEFNELISANDAVPMIQWWDDKYLLTSIIEQGFVMYIIDWVMYVICNHHSSCNSIWWCNLWQTTVNDSKLEPCWFRSPLTIAAFSLLGVQTCINYRTAIVIRTTRVIITM